MYSDFNGTRTHNHLVPKQKLNHFSKFTKWPSWIISTYLYGAFDCMLLSCHVPFQSESTLYIYLNVKELLARNRCDIWSLSDCNGTPIHNPLVRKRKHSTIWPNWPNDFAELWVLICTLHLTVCSCHVMYTFPSEFTLYICLNVKNSLLETDAISEV